MTICYLSLYFISFTGFYIMILSLYVTHTVNLVLVRTVKNNYFSLCTN